MEMSELRHDRTAKAIIGANFHKVDVLPNILGERRKACSIGECPNVLLAEGDVVIFQLRGPIRRETIFNSNAYGPAVAIIGRSPKYGSAITDIAGILQIFVRPGPTTFDVE